MHAPLIARPWWPLALLLIAALSACSTSSPPSPVQPPPVAPPVIPLPPVVAEPPASGTYWTQYCATIERLSTRLSLTLPTFVRCSGPGR